LVYGGQAGQVLLGGTEERGSFETRPSAAARSSILERAVRIVPVLAGQRVLEHVAALRPTASDGLPIVGLATGWDNVGLALGSGRKGMLFGSGVGRAVADLLCEGRTAVPIAPCSPGRASLGRG
jgi:glycine/D-amino acid oxidase-like deaminating enzyme